MFKKKSPSEMGDIGSRRYTPKNICASARRNVVLMVLKAISHLSEVLCILWVRGILPTFCPSGANIECIPIYK
jgi:hypothetical protein